MEYSSEVKKTALQLIGYGALGAPVYGAENFDSRLLNEAFVFARRHDLAQIVAYSIRKLNIKLNEKANDILDNELYDAAIRVERSGYFQNKIIDVLNKNCVDYILLKGSVIRKLYPEDYLRSSIDVDVLVRKEDDKRAYVALKKSLHLKETDRTRHDVTLSDNNLGKAEIHHTICDDCFSKNANEKLSAVWDYCVACGNRYEMSKEAIIFYHVAHAFKHAVEGGCGIKPFVDLKLLLNSGYDEQKLDMLFDGSGFEKFFDMSKKLADYWFFGAQADDRVENFSDYVLSAGVYGTLKNKVAIKAAMGEASIKGRIFWSYDMLKDKYPSLEGKKILTPFYQLKRWFGLTSSKKREKSKNELRRIKSVGKKDIEKAERLLEDLGIDR